MSRRQTLTVDGYYKNLKKIADFVTAAARQAGMDEDEVYAVQMAVDEACTNIIEHAYGGEGRGKIRLTCQPLPNGLQVTIHDQGRPFDPAKVPVLNPNSPAETRSPGGMGLFFIYRLMDRVEFQPSSAGENRLVLVKQRKTQP